jgi:hypothetical protein
VGWQLAEEIAWARPERPGAEWWTLMDIAQDANDETRRGWPGREYLCARSKKSARTIDRYVERLISSGLLLLVKAAAPGRRPVYEIPVLFTCVTNDGARTWDMNAGARPAGSYPQRAPNAAQRATENEQRATRMHGAPPVTTPVTTTRQPLKPPAINSNLEGAPPAAAAPSAMRAIAHQEPLNA